MHTFVSTQMWKHALVLLTHTYHVSLITLCGDVMSGSMVPLRDRKKEAIKKYVSPHFCHIHFSLYILYFSYPTPKFPLFLAHCFPRILIPTHYFFQSSPISFYFGCFPFHSPKLDKVLHFAFLSKIY